MAEPEKGRAGGMHPEPLIIPRSQHPVSRQLIDREALKVMYRLRDAGHTAYLVGGGVRDIYLGKKPKDFDISTDARPGQIRKLFRNSRVIGKRFRLVQIFFPVDKIVEVSTFRRPSEYDLNTEDEVLPSNNTFGTEADDAFRRDLTINALFYEIEKFTVIDYTGGVQDLKDGVVRIIGDPARRITRDPVRMMRAVRHAARSGFVIEEHTLAAIRTHGAMLSLCPISRIRDELLRDLQGGASRQWARLCAECGLLQVLFPFYEGVSDAALEKLFSLLGVADRLHQEGQRIPEYFLHALIFLPWLEERQSLMDEVREGKQANQYSRQLRIFITENLGYLSIKRAVQEQMTGMLVNLPLFAHHWAQGKWPRWLTKKSYFTIGQQFCAMYLEAMGERDVSNVSFDAEIAETKSSPRKRRPRKGNRTPAYAEKSKSGIFGLNKRR